MSKPEQLARDIATFGVSISLLAEDIGQDDLMRLATDLTIKCAELLRALEPEGFRTKQ